MIIYKTEKVMFLSKKTSDHYGHKKHKETIKRTTIFFIGIPIVSYDKIIDFEK